MTINEVWFPHEGFRDKKPMLKATKDRVKADAKKADAKKTKKTDSKKTKK